jgi:hypothetical protein
VKTTVEHQALIIGAGATAVCKNIEPFTALGGRCQAYIQQHVHPESEDTTRVEALDIIKLMTYH